MPFQYDESDPQLLIVYVHAEHTADDYRDLMVRWVERLDGERFGVLMVEEPHDHTDDDDHEEQYATINRLINDFRRQHRTRANQKMFGYVRVLDSGVMDKYIADYNTNWEQVQESVGRYTKYVWGTRGHLFTEIEPAKRWLLQQADLPPLDLDDDPNPSEASSNKVGLFFGSTSGVTEKIAYDIQAAWQQTGIDALTPINIGDAKDLSTLLAYDYLILGIPTWDIGQLQDDWYIAFPHLSKLDFTGKRIALFGIGDQYGYADNFLDALGILAKELRQRGAVLVGLWDASDYQFEASLALEDGKFLGLGIDEINQADKTADRIQRWLTQIITEFELEPSTQA